MGAAAVGLFCCHVQTLAPPRSTVAAAPVAGPRPGVLPAGEYDSRYVEVGKDAEGVDDEDEGSEEEDEENQGGSEKEREKRKDKEEKEQGKNKASSSSAPPPSRPSRRAWEVEARGSGLRFFCRSVPKPKAPPAGAASGAGPGPRTGAFGASGGAIAASSSAGGGGGGGGAVARHLEALCGVEHPHLCKLVECFECEDEYLLIYEKAYAPTLLDFIVSRTKTTQLPELEAAEVVRQLVSALAHALVRGAVHGGIHPGCLLLAAKNGGGPRGGMPPQVKLADMGLGFLLRDPLHDDSPDGDAVRGGTDFAEGDFAAAGAAATTARRLFAAPENCPPLRSDEDLASPTSAPPSPLPLPRVGSFSASPALAAGGLEALADDSLEAGGAALWDRTDIWAVGCIACYLLVGAAPRPIPVKSGKTTGKLQIEGAAFDGDAWDRISTKGKEAVSSMLALIPRLRPTASALLRMPWLKLNRPPAPGAAVRNLYRNAMLNMRECHFKKLVHRIIVEQLPKDHKHLGQAAAMLVALDKDYDGLLDVDEFLQGFKHYPDLLQAVPDARSLFEAADRSGSGCLCASELAAAALPPTLARDQLTLWNVFRAFDREQSGTITIDEVLEVARMLEGTLLSPTQNEELSEVLRAELQTISVALDPDAAAADSGPLLAKCTPKKYRPIDFEEFFYLFAVREHKGACGKVMQKEVFRCVLKTTDMDLHCVRDVAGELRWPPSDVGDAARGARSVHQAKGGLVGQRDADRRKSRHAGQSGHHRRSSRRGGAASAHDKGSPRSG